MSEEPAPEPAAVNRLSEKMKQLRHLKIEGGQLSYVLGGLRSPDPATRRMSIFFVISLVGTLWVAHLTIDRLRSLKSSAQPHAAIQVTNTDAGHLGKFIQKEANVAKHKFSTYTMGTFTLELKPVPHQKKIPGVMNLAEIEIVVECDSRKTLNYIEDNIAQARNQVTNILTTADREQLLSKKGKGRLKKKIIDRLNSWLPEGKVNEVYISKLALS